MTDLIAQLQEQGCYLLGPFEGDTSNGIYLNFEFEKLPLLYIAIYDNYASVGIQNERFKVENQYLVDMMKGLNMLLKEFKERFDLKWLEKTDFLQITLDGLFPYKLSIVTNLKGLIMFVLSNDARKDFTPVLGMYQRNFRMYEFTNIAVHCRQTRVITKVHDALVRAAMPFTQEGHVFFCENNFTIICHGNHFQLVISKQSSRVKVDLLTKVTDLVQYFNAFKDIAHFNINNIKKVTITGCYSCFIGVFYDEFLVYKGKPNGKILYRLQHKIDRILKEKKLND